MRLLTPDVWARGVALFCILALVKCALLVHFGRHIFESHWRVALPEVTGVGKAAFMFFVVLGAASLFRLERACRVVESTRLANGVVVGLGLTFIFLTFNSGENNFLYPILTGVLPWSSLGPYLSVKLCFERPYLAGWLLAYGAGYYILARTGREGRALRMTAVFAAGYALVNLRELSIMRDELLLLDVIGVVSVAFGWRRCRPSEPDGALLSWLLPVFWSALFAAEMLRLAPNNLWLSKTYFLLLIATTAILFAGAILLARARRYVAGWMGFGFFYFAGFLLLTDSHHPIALNFNQVLCLSLEVPHYFVAEMLLSAIVMVAAAAAVWGRPSVRRTWNIWLVDIAAIGLIVIALVDFRLSQLLGVRLGWDALALGNSPKMIWRMAAPYLPLVGGFVLLMAGGYIWAVHWVRRRLEAGQLAIASGEHPDSERQPPNSTGAGRNLFGIFPSSAALHSAVVFLALAIAGVFLANPDKAEGNAAVQLVRTSSIWRRAFDQPMAPDEFARTARALGLENLSHPPPLSAARKRDLNVVLIFLESTYNKHLSLFSGSEDTQPLLSQYKERMELFPNFFSCFASSIHARFAAFTGLYPVRDYNAFTLERVPVKSIFELMHENGYSCSMFYSSYLDFTGFRAFLANRGLDETYDADSMPGQRKTQRISWGLQEEETLEAMRARVRKYAVDKTRFFMTYVPAAPHYPYDQVPERFQKYRPSGKNDLRALYLNELLYIDWVMSSLLYELKQTGLLDETLVVITDDHGEMLGGEGEAIGHGWWLTSELANVPLIIMDPQKPGYRINPRTGSQVDLLPTILDLAGIPIPPEELYEGRSLLAPAQGEKIAWLNSYQQYGVLRGRTLAFGDREQPQKGSMAAGFAIRNEGVRTLFEPKGTVALPGSIAEFDRFQEGLLKNYGFYRTTIGAMRAGAVVARQTVQD